MVFLQDILRQNNNGKKFQFQYQDQTGKVVCLNGLVLKKSNYSIINGQRLNREFFQS